MKTSTLIWFVTIIFLASAATASAAAIYTPPFGGQQKVDSQGIAYMSGGVSINERHIMDDMASGYNLKLVFDVRSGDYVSGVAVQVRDAAGKVLVDTVSAGPWFYASLPSGTYRVAADYNGKTIVQTVKLEKPARQLIMTWSGC